MLSGRILDLAEGAGWRIVLLVGIGVAITGSYIGQGLLVAGVIRDVFAGAPLDGVVMPIFAAVGLQAVRAALFVWRDASAMALGGTVKERVRTRLYRRLLELGPGPVIRGRTGDLTSTFVDGVELLERYFGTFVPQIGVAVIGAAITTAVIWTIDPIVGFVVLACAAIVPLAPIVSRRLLRPAGDEWWRLYHTVYSENIDALQGMSTLKAFGAATARGEQLHEQASAFSRAAVRLTLVSTVFLGMVGFAESAGTALAVGIGALRLAGGSIEPMGLLVILLLARECFRPLVELQTAFHQAYSAMATADGIFTILDAEPELAPAPAPTAPMSSAEPLSITFESVTFRYQADAPEALDRLSLTVAPGETVALVGRSGSGKSTAVSLLLRFFDPQGGRILVDGRDVRTIPLDELRSLVAVVAQDTYLFHGTVADNLRLARPDATDDELTLAARDAEALGFIERLPNGFETLIGERGLRLSGGERQRLAIARALLKRAPLLVLDEATSSIDAASEAAIQAALARLRAGRTVLVIAHRLSTVRNADRIVVLADGHAVEAGDHAELVADGGAYARLVAAQEGTA